MDSSAERRLVENELLFRAANQKVQKQVQKDHLPRNGVDESKLHFYCECSNFHCRDRVIITADEYDAAHTDTKYFTIIPGHENRAVEKVIRKTLSYSVVEKFMDPAEVVKSS